MAVITKDTFDPLRRYVGVRLQQGVPIVDADWNEMEDTRRFEMRAFLKWFIGDGVPSGNNGFLIQTPGTLGDFVISAGITGNPDGLSNVGRALVNGLDVIIDKDVKYVGQKLHVSQDPQGKLAAAWNVPPIPVLPVVAQSLLLVYLDVWERLVTPNEDPSLVQPGLQVESCARLKREWAVRVRAAAKVPVPGEQDFVTGHSYLALATIRNLAANTPPILIQDIRVRSVSLQSLVDGTATLDVKSMSMDGPLRITGGNWDVANGEGDVRIGNDALRLKMGVALGGGGAGDARIHAHGGTNRLMLGAGATDKVTVTPDGVGIGYHSPHAALSFGNSVANTKIALWDNGANAMYGLGIAGAQFRLHTDTPSARFTFLDAPAGNEMVNLRGNGGSNALMDIGHPNPIRFSSVHTGFSNNVLNQAEISSDTNTYKTLMLVGNKAAGIKDGGGTVLRRVSVWDRLEVHGGGAIMYSVTAGAIPAWVTDPNAPAYKWAYECVGVNHQSHNLRLVSPNGVYVHAPAGFFVDGAPGTKHFRIPHPLEPDKRHLVHACIEGPEVGVYYRGQGHLVDGIATVELPRYFEALTRKEGRTVQLTPIWDGPGKPCSQLAAAEVRDGRFTVHAVDKNNAAQRFYWEVKAVRDGVAPLETEPLKQE